MAAHAIIAGVGMTDFGKFPERGLKSLAGEAINSALADAGLQPGEVEAAYMGNAAASLITGQAMIAGQVILRSLGIGRIPVVNVENACATSATAFQQAERMIACGQYDVVLAAGFEKLFHKDKARTFSVFMGAVDVEGIPEFLASLNKGNKSEGEPGSDKRSVFMDIYAAAARRHMQLYGTTARHFAMVSAKNSYHGSLNPHAQYREVLGVDEVLAAPSVAPPLTLPMCAPIGDGAAAVILVSEKKARAMGLKQGVRVRSSILASGWDRAEGENESVVDYAARKAYEAAGIEPRDINVIELHDATAPAEILCYESLGLAKKGEGARLIEDGATRLGGRIPVNTSGGLLRKGHPVGATGAAQIFELCEQLRGRAGARQVEGARLGVAENGGGFIGSDAAAVVVTVLEKAG
jgi:acetyl-CoA acetyltransferase